MFKIFKTDDGRTCPQELKPAGAITPKLGMALAMSGGKLAVAAGATKPQYISMIEKTEACAAGDMIPVIRVDGDIIFETTASAAMTSINPGDRVTLHTDGGQVTAATTSGVAEVVGMEGTAAGSTVYVRF